MSVVCRKIEQLKEQKINLEEVEVEGRRNLLGENYIFFIDTQGIESEYNKNKNYDKVPSGVRKSSCILELNVPQSPLVFPR